MKLIKKLNFLASSYYCLVLPYASFPDGVQREEGASPAETTLEDDKLWAAALVNSLKTRVGHPGCRATSQHCVHTPRISMIKN